MNLSFQNQNLPVTQLYLVSRILLLAIAPWYLLTPSCMKSEPESNKSHYFRTKPEKRQVKIIYSRWANVRVKIQANKE